MEQDSDYAFGVILTRIEESVKDVVLIRRDDKLINRKAHLVDHPASKNIAKISGRDDEVYIITMLRRKLHVGMNVVNRLSKDANDVDRVDRGKMKVFFHCEISHELFDNGLAIIKAAFNRDRKDVVRSCASHLTLLKF